MRLSHLRGDAMRRLYLAVLVAAVCTPALHVALGSADAIAQQGPEHPVFPNLDLTVPETRTSSSPGDRPLGVDNSHISSPVEPALSGQGLYLGRSRTGEGRFFIYGENVEHVDERTGQSEAASQKFGIRVNTDLR